MTKKMPMKFLFTITLLLTTLFSSSNTQTNILSDVKNYVIKKYSLKIPKREFKILPSTLHIENNYAMLVAIPVYEDGSYISTEYFEDIVFVLCLEKKDNSWKIIYDFSRNDIPSEEEMLEIKQNFPTNFPKKLLSNFWLKRLK